MLTASKSTSKKKLTEQHRQKDKKTLKQKGTEDLLLIDLRLSQSKQEAEQ